MVMQYEDFKRLNSDNDDGGGVKLMSVQRWGARSDASPAANTTGITNAIKWQRAGADRALLFPDANYKLAGAIKVGESANDVITGLRLYGQSSGGTVLEQTTDGVAIFELNAALIDACAFERLSFKYTNMQSSSNASVFFHISGTDAVMSNCSWRDIGGSNFFYLMHSPQATWSGNSLEDVNLGDFAGGVTKIIGAKGAPNCKFERIYINAPSARQMLFDHEGMTAAYDNIAIRNLQDTGIIEDHSGGFHVVGRLALDTATFNSGKTLFNLPGSTLIGDHVSIENVKVTGTNSITVYATNNGGLFDVRLQTTKAMDPAHTGYIVACWSGGPKRVRFGEIIMPWSDKVLLTDSFGASDFLSVDSWNDETAMTVRGDADVTLNIDSAVIQVFRTLTAARTVTLPEARNLFGNNMFGGRRFRVQRPVLDGAFPINIKDKQGATIATIPANLTGEIEVVWHRQTGWYVAWDTTKTTSSGGGTGVTNGVLPIDGAANAWRGVQVQAAGKTAWGFGANQSNAAVIDRYDSAGAWIESSFSVDPTTGVPTFAKNPLVPDVPTADYTQKAISSKFFWDAFLAQASTVAPVMDGAASTGSSQAFARADHRHPTDTSLAPVALVSGKAPDKSVAGTGTTALTAAESAYAILKFTGALTGNKTVTTPAASGRWSVVNATTGAFTLTFKTPSGTGVTIGQGKTRDVICDGTNILPAENDGTDLGVPVAATATPLADGTAAVGTSTKYAREDHVHPAGSGGGASTLKQSALNNWKKSNTNTLRAILARGASPLSKARGRLFVVGDSYMAGYASGNVDGMTNARANSASAQLANMLTARGIRASAHWNVGDGYCNGDAGASSAQLTAYDPRATFTGSAGSLGASFHSLGGGMISLDVGATMTFQPKDAAGNAFKFDTIEIIVASSIANGGTFKVEAFAAATGGTALTPTIATQNNNNIVGSKKLVLTCGPTAQRVVITTLTGTCFIQALGVRMSSSVGVEVINMCASGIQVATLAAPKGTGDGNLDTWNNYVAGDVIYDTGAAASQTLPLNATLINGWFNDEGAYTVAQCQANLDNLIKYYKAKGDVMYIGYGPIRSIAMDPTTFNTWQTAMYATCIANDIPYIDPPAEMVDAETAYGWGMFGDGGWHYGSDGHALLARMILAGFDSIM